MPDSNSISLLGVVLGLCGGAVTTVGIEGFRLRRASRKRPRMLLARRERLAARRVAGSPCAFARLALTNDPESNAAVGARVRLERVESLDGVEGPEASLSGWHLAWGDDDQGDANVPSRAETIGPGASREIDVVHLNSAVPESLIVDVRPQPQGHINYLPGGRYRLELAVECENASTRLFTVDVDRDGLSWDGDPGTAPDRVRLGQVSRL